MLTRVQKPSQLAHKIVARRKAAKQQQAQQSTPPSTSLSETKHTQKSEGGHMKLTKVVLVVAIFAPFIALACSFDTDCSPGSKCVKASGQIYGVCAGGISPGNANDRQPVYSPLDPNRTTGNTCSFDIDCGPGSKCVKSQSSIYGVCLRSR